MIHSPKGSTYILETSLHFPHLSIRVHQAAQSRVHLFPRRLIINQVHVVLSPVYPIFLACKLRCTTYGRLPWADKNLPRIRFCALMKPLPIEMNCRNRPARLFCFSSNPCDVDDLQPIETYNWVVVLIPTKSFRSAVILAKHVLFFDASEPAPDYTMFESSFVYSICRERVYRRTRTSRSVPVRGAPPVRSHLRDLINSKCLRQGNPTGTLLT